jgi:coenzyme F420 hydrogenase subunit beta
VCPRYRINRDDVEKHVFSRAKTPDEPFGIHQKIYVAQSVNDAFLTHGQDGGVASTLLSSALDAGTIDAAIVSGLSPSAPWLPIPTIATNKDELLHSAGTRYTYSPNLLVLNDCIAKGFEKVAFVGTPCQILAFRRIQMVPLKKIAKMVVFTLGLFCSESFTYSGLMVDKIQNQLDVTLADLRKMNIKGKMVLILSNGAHVDIPLKEAKQYAEGKCSYCNDFSAELADISLGGVGLNKRTFMVVRTNIGEQIVDQAMKNDVLNMNPVEDYSKAYNLLHRLSKLKAKKAKPLV